MKIPRSRGGPRRLLSMHETLLKEAEMAMPDGPRHILTIDRSGDCTIVTKEKHDLAEQLDIPFRDMRVVDPLVPIPYPIDIMVREKAIVLNLESIRMIITQDQAYVLSAPDPKDYDGPLTRWVFPTEDNYFIKELIQRLQTKLPTYKDGLQNGGVEQRLPFELKMLEGALENIVCELATEVQELMEKASPALDALVSRVTRRELETVRHVKTLHQGLMNRAQRLRDELESLLDDDEDMADLYLTKRGETQEKWRNTIVALEQSAAERGERGLDNPLADESLSEASELSSRLPAAQSQRIPVDPHSIVAAENLLESYFMQIEYLLRRLNMLDESIDDTEDLINIELDQRRNQLVALDLIVTVFAAGFGLIAAIAGICGMNLSPLPIQNTEAPFFGVTIGSCLTAILAILGVFAYAKYNNILVFVPRM